MKKKILLYISLLWSVWGTGFCAVTNQQLTEQKEIHQNLTSDADFAITNQTEYAAIWQKQNDGAIWQARHGMSELQYQQTAERMKRKGFRTVHISGHGSDKMVRFVGIWTEKGDIDWQARHNLTWDEYRSIDKELTDGGYQLTSLNDYLTYGESRYAAVWERNLTQLTLEPDTRQLTSEYQKAFEELIEKGYKLVNVSELGHHQDDRYGAIWWERRPLGLIGSKSILDYFSHVKQDQQALQNAHNSFYLP